MEIEERVNEGEGWGSWPEDFACDDDTDGKFKRHSRIINAEWERKGTESDTLRVHRQKRRREKKKKKKKCERVCIGDRFSSLALAFSFATPKKRRLSASLALENGGSSPFHLPYRDSSQFFFELFVSNFTSPPCHVASSFFFPVCPSAIRGVDELALRVSAPLPTPPSLVLPLFPLFSLFLPPSPLSLSFFVPSPFSSISRLSFRLPPFFALLFLVSRSFHRFFLDSPLPPPPTPYRLILSLFCRVRWFHLLVPSLPLLPGCLRRYFLVAPSLPWLYATLSLSLSTSLLPSSHPNSREKQPPLSLVLPHITISRLYPPLFLPGFFSLPLSIRLSIFLFLSFPYPRLRLSLLSSSCSSHLAPPVLSPRSAFYVFPALSTSPPRLFPDFSLSRPLSSRRRPTSSFSGKTQAETTAVAPLFCPRFCRHSTPSPSHAFPGWKDWNLPGEFPPFSSFAAPLSFPPPSSLSTFAFLFLSPSFFPSFAERCG